jgi:hypothetical protein
MEGIIAGAADAHKPSQCGPTSIRDIAVADGSRPVPVAHVGLPSPGAQDRMSRFLPPAQRPVMLRILEEALTFDDVLLVPARSEVLPMEVSLATRYRSRRKAVSA